MTETMASAPSDEERSTSVMFDAGRHCHEAGQLQQAQAIYDRVLSLAPDHADSFHLSGVIALQTGQPGRAVSLIGRALAIDPDHAAYRNNMGNALRSLGRIPEAVSQLRIAARLRPESAEIHSNLANALRDMGGLDEAVAHYRLALRLRPDLPELFYNHANLLAELGDPAAAEAGYREALRLKPDYAAASYNLANTLVRLCRLEEAETCYRAALTRQADLPEAHNNLGMVLQEFGRVEEAEACYYAALRLKPTCIEALYNLGTTFQARNRLYQAIRCYDQLLGLKPDHGAARLARCMAQLPILYAEVSEIACRRQAYQGELERLCQDAAQGTVTAALAEAIGTSQPFFLAYQEQDDRELQRLYGTMASHVLARRTPAAPLAPPPTPGERLRVGIVSGFFYDHTIWRLLIRGWLMHLDRQRIKVFGYHTGLKRDAQTDCAAALSDRFLEGRWNGQRWRQLILADAPHVLLYPEIGMDPMAAHLAAQRLAPVQCNSWGHPNTSGLPTQDYFLSSDLMEPSDGADHYTERLIRLPNLATSYQPEVVPPQPLNRVTLGLRPEATVYWSGQALYKYLPQYDQVFPRIASEVGDCQFVFIEFAKSRDVTALFRRRLDLAFAGQGLKATDHCVFLHPMDQEHFIAAVRHSDILLDTIGWSGGRSTLDCLAHDAPVVTLAGRFMRGRHTAAILLMMGVPETITSSLDDYVSVAVLLAKDPWWRAALQARMAANRHRVFNDRTCIKALEDFLDQAVRSRQPSTRSPSSLATATTAPAFFPVTEASPSSRT